MRKMRQRDYLKRTGVKTNNELDWLNYRNARNKVNIAVKAAKSNYFNKGIHESCGNVREIWKLINSTLGRKTKITLINELSCGGQTYTDKKEIAYQMNLHFCTLGEKLAKNIPVTGTYSPGAVHIKQEGIHTVYVYPCNR